MISFSNPYTVVFDLEYTAWKGSLERGWSRLKEHREIVQIGAVKLDNRRAFKTVATFEKIVHPKINPKLSNYFSKLTGITNDRISVEGIAFPKSIASFAEFVDDSGLLLSYGNDLGVILENCSLHRIVCPIPKNRFLNIDNIVCNALGLNHRPQSGELLHYIGVKMPTRIHDALEDARTIADIIRFLHRHHKI